jgi:carboxylate-amine ligase
MRTFGVEEELLLVDSATGSALPLGEQVQRLAANQDPASRLTTEFQLEQTEVSTRPHSGLDRLADELRENRALADAAARKAGARIAALATPPTPLAPSTTPLPRFLDIASRFGITAREQLTCGCHVHVSVDSDEEGVAVLDRIRGWLPVLAALCSNSPFWNGMDTGYEGYRAQAWRRWPATGPCETFGSAEAYHAHVRQLLGAGVLLDHGMLYFDARLSSHLPTVEVRVSDVCLEADDAVLLAALCRALVTTAAAHWRAGRRAPAVSGAVLRLAAWRASRWGLGGELLAPDGGGLVPALDVVNALMDYVRPALAEAGDDGVADRLLRQLLDRGTGAQRQRAVFARTGDLAAVVRDAVAVTTA